MKKDQFSPNQGGPRQAPALIPQRVPFTTTASGDAERQVTFADKEGDLVLFDI